MVVVFVCKYLNYFRFYSGDLTKIKDDAALVKPTIFIGVPRLFNRIVDGVKQKFEETTGIGKCLINSGI